MSSGFSSALGVGFSATSFCFSSLVTLSCIMINKLLLATEQDQSVIVFINDESDVEGLTQIIAKNLKVNKDDMVSFSVDEGVEILREKIGNFHLKPNSSPKRLFVVYGADLLNRPQANTLLKTLEEPPGFGKVILFAKNKARVLPTILSRCHLVYYKNTKEYDRESIVALSKGLKIKDFLYRVKQIDRVEAIALLEGGLEELRQKGLNESKGQVFKQIGSSIALLEGTNCNHRLVLERLYMLIKSKEK